MSPKNQQISRFRSFEDQITQQGCGLNPQFSTKFKLNEYCLFQVTLEPYERDHAVVVGIYRAAPKKKE